jgi:hypothetical protein
MNLESLQDTANISFLEAQGSDGRGNIVLRIEDGSECLVLKLYRPRYAWQELTGGITDRILHKKTGRNVQARFETERRNLDSWTAQGFDVFRRVERPLPAGIDPPGLWFEYCPGRLLSDVIRDDTISWHDRKGLLSRLSAETGRRQLRALELSDVSLVQEHGTIEHILLHNDRMITFDLEEGFLPHFPLIEALAEELSGYLRSIAKTTGDRFDDAIRTFAEGYPSRDVLRRIAEWGVAGSSFYRRLKRFQDRKRRHTFGKTDVLRQLLAILR